MRHGRSYSSLLKPSSSSSSQLSDLLLVASVTKTLSLSGTRSLDPHSLPLSEPLIIQILRKPSLDPSQKLSFFRWCSASLSHFYKHSACAYSTIFRSVCTAGYLSEVPDLLISMKGDGVVVDSGTFMLLLDAFLRLGKFDSALQILDHMEELGVTVNARMYCSVLVALIRKNQLASALSIFYKLLDASDCSVAGVLDSIACNELLVSLKKEDMRVEFKNVFDKLMKKTGFKLDTWGYNICIHAFGCWGDLATSLSLFKEMKENSVAGPDLCTYNSLIQVLSSVGKVKDALIVWDELNVSGHEPDAFTYRIIIQGCCKAYRIDDATKIFDEMEYNGFRPDTVVYNSLIDGLFKARKVTEACQLFEKMVYDGIRASRWTYNILIDGLFRNGRIEAGYTMFSDLKKKGQFVDGVTYSIVVMQLCREGELEKALNLVEGMEARGFDVDLVTITSLLIGFHRHGRWGWTDRLMKHIRDGNILPSVLKWRTNMEASVKSPPSRREDYTEMFPSKDDFTDVMNLIGSVLDANHGSEDECIQNKKRGTDIDQWSSSPYLDHLANQVKSTDSSSRLFLLSRGQRVQANRTGSFDIDMVNTFLSIFLSKGKLSLACKLFEIFTDMGVNPVGYTYNSMMSSFVKKGYFNQAWGVLSEMVEKICPADMATYNVMIQGLGKMGRADLASIVVDKLMKQGGHLDIVMYNTLINELGKAGRIDEANELFNQMRGSGINPDVVTFNTMIEVHSKAGRLKEAHKFLKMMLDSGCLPNHVTDTTLDFLGKEIEKTRYQKASMKRNKDGES